MPQAIDGISDIDVGSEAPAVPRAEDTLHPGQFIRMTVLEPLGLSVTEAAKVLRVTRPALSALLNGRASLSPDMAIRVEKAFGPTMDSLMEMQTRFDIREARKRKDQIDVERYVPRARPAAQTQRLL